MPATAAPAFGYAGQLREAQGVSAVLAPLDLRTAEAMLQHVHGSDDRETWLAIGMALKSEFGDEAFEIWNAWSSTAGNYNFRACNASWRGFRAGGGGYTIGTLIKLAKDGGYRATRSEAGSPAPDFAALEQRRLERIARASDEQARRAAQALNAENVALEQWRAAAREGASPYLERKGIAGAESVRFDGDAILVPMLRYDYPREQSLKGLQRITPDGSKKFTYGVAKTGTACRLGLAAVGEPVFVCEGYATGMSLRMGMEALLGSRKYAVFVAFDAGNLVSVVDVVHQALPSNPIVICADDDWRTFVGGIAHNTGKIQAQIAQDALHDAGFAHVCRAAPVFTSPKRGDKQTDFNDLHALEGLPEVAVQLQTALDCIEELRRHG